MRGWLRSILLQQHITEKCIKCFLYLFNYIYRILFYHILNMYFKFVNNLLYMSRHVYGFATNTKKLMVSDHHRLNSTKATSQTCMSRLGSAWYQT